MRARTSTEATTYMDLHGCACGANRFTRTRTLLQDGDRLLARYSGPCDGCGTVRSFTFELSDESPGAENSFGEGCSEILDAGEFLFVSDRMAGSVPMEPPADRGEAGRAHDRMALARDALAQVLAFGSSAMGGIPARALVSDLSREVPAAYRRPFGIGRLKARLEAYDQVLARYAAALR